LFETRQGNKNYFKSTSEEMQFGYAVVENVNAPGSKKPLLVEKNIQFHTGTLILSLI
jgi:hypothetical protein